MNYKTSNYGKKASRRDYSKVHMHVELPDLIEIQTKSFKEFVETGLKEIFEDLSPIVSNNGELKLYFGMLWMTIYWMKMVALMAL